VQTGNNANRYKLKVEKELQRSSSGTVDKARYQSAVGSLIYAATATRPDIAYAVGEVSQYLSEPSAEHWTLDTYEANHALPEENSWK
jgi:hypothetical protein